MDIMTILGILSAIVSTSSMITSALPNKNKKGERIFATANKILNILAFNFGNAKNKED